MSWASYQFGILWHERFDQILTVRCNCSAEGGESQEA